MINEITVKEVSGAEVPMDILLLADPSEAKIKAYLKNSKSFVALIKNMVIGACVVQPREGGAYELMSIAVQINYQKSGIGTILLKWVIEYYRKSGAKKIEVGTGTFGYQLAFYQKQGFRVTKIDKDYFINNYEQPIFENGIRLMDMLRLTLKYPVNE